MKRIYMLIMTILCSIGIAVAISYAWFLNDENVDPIAQGRSGSAYFAYGDGGITKPYGINQPRHLYNLAWLVYLFPETYANLKYEIDPSLSETLNMNGWVLPPIGTDANPFTGYFNGNGKTIENLTTSNNVNNMNTKPNDLSSYINNSGILSNCENIGLFGSIGKASQNETATKIYNFYLEDTIIETAQSPTCIGIVAGYVDAKIENVGVINSGIDLGDDSHTLLNGRSNLSDYTVVGYATEDYTTSIGDKHTILYNPTTNFTHFNFIGMGNGNGFGGSIDMQKLYNRIKSANPKTTTVSEYVVQELQYKGFEENEKTVRYAKTSHSERAYKDFEDERGTYLKNTDVDDLYQAITSLYKDVLTVTKTNSTVSGFTINNHDDIYCNLKSEYVTNTITFSVSISNATPATGNTVWVEESNSTGVNLFTYNEDDGHKYYLIANNDLSVSASYQDSCIWHWDSLNNCYYTIINSTEYYLKYFKDSWTVKPLYIIGDGQGTYLVNNNNTIDKTTNILKATPFMFSNYGQNPGGTIMLNNGYYLRNNNGVLQISSNSTIWSNDGYGIYNDGYYLQYNGSTWVVSRPLDFYISYNDGTNDNYLSFDYNGGNPRLINSTTAINTWKFETNNGTPSGTISYYCSDNSRTYYLINNNGSLEIDYLDDTEWSNGSNGIYDGNYYIQFNKDDSNKWVLSTRGFYITFEEGSTIHYLSLSGSTIVDVTNEANATLWKATNWSNDGLPSGTISTYSNTNYYLYYNSLLQVSSSSSTTWSNDGEKFAYQNSYIQFYKGKWICGRVYYISNGTNYLSTTNGTSLVATENKTTEWIVTNNNNTTTPSGYIYTLYNNTLKFINYSNYSIRLGSQNTSWSNDGTGLYNGTFYLQLGTKISYNGHYLNRNGTSNVSESTNESTATTWYFDTSNRIFTRNNNSTYYLYLKQSGYWNYTYSVGITNSSNSSLLWIKNGNSIELQNNDGIYLIYEDGRWYYGRMDSITFSCEIFNSLTNITNANSKAKTISSKLAVNNQISLSEMIITTNKGTSSINVYTRDIVEQPSLFTCIPINANETTPYSVEANNTGYIMSGGHEPSETNADIRVSQFTQVDNIGAGIAGSFKNSDHTWINNKIYTIGTNGLGVIADSGTPSGTSYSKSLYENYETSRSTLRTTLTSSGSYVYGLHFMDCKISMNHLVVADNIKLATSENVLHNYEMPEDCIDFNLKTKGYITVYSGYYFQGTGGTNNAFFSLHEIIRDPSTKKITQIRHILNIYRKIDDNTYIYKYIADDPNSNGIYEEGYYYFDSETNTRVTVQESTLFSGNTLKSGYELKFDKEWVEHPYTFGGSYNTISSFYDQYKTNVFYFEIPVNKGEYAIGSVDGGVGTYLMYLDIGANAAYVDRTEITQVTQNVTYTFKYVNGIQVLSSNTEVTVSNINAANSVDVIAKQDSTGKIVLKKTNSSTIQIENDLQDGNAISKTASYKGTVITTFNGDLSEVPKAIVTTKVLKIIDYNNGEGRIYRTTITKVGTADAEALVHKIDKSDLATNLNLYDTTVNPVPDGNEYGLLRRGTSSDIGKEGYGIVTDAETLINNATFRAYPSDLTNNYYDSITTDNENKLLEYHCWITPNSETNLNAVSESILLTVGVVSDERKINGHSINAGTNKYTDGDYVLQHVYRMTGDTITISSTQLSSIIDNNVKVLVYAPTLVEATGDANPNYTFTINGTVISAVTDTVNVTSAS